MLDPMAIALQGYWTDGCPDDLGIAGLGYLPRGREITTGSAIMAGGVSVQGYSVTGVVVSSSSTTSASSNIIKVR